MEIDYTECSTTVLTRDVLKSVIMQQSLIEKKSSIASIEMMPDDTEVKSIFLGTGISKPDELTQAVPFDFLVFPLVAAKIQKTIGNCHVHHLIADNHALINNLGKKGIRHVAVNYRKMIEDIIGNMDIENYHIYLASEIATDKNYQLLLDQILSSNFSNEYSRYEATDVEYFHRTRQVSLKLGWKFNGESKYDEASFDSDYKKCFGRNVYSIYTVSGKRFDDKKPNTVPYTVYKSEMDHRLIVSKDEDVFKKINLQKLPINTAKMIENHYKGLVRLYEEVCHKIPSDIKSVWQKVQYIIQMITEG